MTMVDCIHHCLCIIKIKILESLKLVYSKIQYKIILLGIGTLCCVQTSVNDISSEMSSGLKLQVLCVYALNKYTAEVFHVYVLAL